MEILKRIVRLNPDPGDIELEADPRHVLRLVRCSMWRSASQQPRRERVGEREEDKAVGTCGKTEVPQ